MTDNSPGPSSPIELVPTPTKRNIELCIVCQMKKDTSSATKLTSTPEGRKNVIQVSNLLNDDLLNNLNDRELTFLKYHVKTCYARYKKSGERYAKKQEAKKKEENDLLLQSPSRGIEITNIESRCKRRKTSTDLNPKDKPCVICNLVKHKGTSERFRISENARAKHFICAYTFHKDDVYTRCVLYKTPGDIFAADVMYHKKCLETYFSKFRREVEAVLLYEDTRNDTEEVLNIFKTMVYSLELDSHGYAVSDIRQLLNQRFIEEEIDYAVSNRQLKIMLINLFGEEICFSYPKDRQKSQMFFSAKIRTADVAETLRKVDPVKLCADKLRTECENFDFLLQGSFNSAEDLEISFEQYVQHRPVTWDSFFDSMFPYRRKSENIKRKCDTIFQIIFYIVHNSKKKMPLHVSICESIHDTCRSKNLIQTMNKIGLCMSYDELLRTDMNLAQRTINIAGNYRVPVPPVIKDSVIIQGAMDNFDNEENTSSGIGGSHDTILMLFQNAVEEVLPDEKQMSVIPLEFTSSKRSLDYILNCQNLIKCGRFSGRGEIPADFTTQNSNKDQSSKNSSAIQHKLWVLARYSVKSNIPSLFSRHSSGIPSFTATNSLLNADIRPVTRIAFTPIIPHPATEFDTIHTAMLNFQDVLLQKGLEYGPLWSDEGVYRIAKELQLLNQEKFSNIFLGIGGFHMEKVIIGCCGKYLEDSGIDSVLVENEIYGPNNVKSVLDGGNYIRGKRGMSLISESLEHLQLSAFFKNTDPSKYKTLFENISVLQSLFETPNQHAIAQAWEQFKNESSKFMEDFNKFKQESCEKSKSFSYWNRYLNEIVPILQDLTRSFREGDWNLHLSSVQRAIPLCFAFDRVNYKRWLPIYYEDCLTLPVKFPEMHDCFVKGGFVVKHTRRSGSAVPMDQALEKTYNKPAKGQSGIIGFSRRKDAVCKWNIIKHEKANYTSFLRQWCTLDENDEYSLHHEFSKSITEADETCVNQITEYIKERFTPFETAKESEIVNIVTKTQISAESREFLTQCLELGETNYKEFHQSRLVEKTVKLFDTIPKTKKEHKLESSIHKVDLSKETIAFMRNIDYARLRNFSIKTLMQFELTSTSFYLVKDGYPRKPDKAELAAQLRKLVVCPKFLPPNNDKRMVIIDFMGYARKVPVKKMKLKTFSHLAANLWSTFEGLSRSCCRTDIIFDLYNESSIKGSERCRRSKTPGVYTTVSRFDQPLPVEFEKFWSVSSNKVSFQQFFTDWLTNKYVGINIVYLGGSNKEDQFSCMQVLNGLMKEEPLLKCSHEEADDRILFHLSHGVKISNFCDVVIASPDTDVLVSSIYHFGQLMFFDLKYLWFITGRSSSRFIIPIHDLISVMESDLIDILPAVHALTGCDTTSKIGTKTSAFKTAEKYGYELIYSFGKSELTEQMINNAERFLVRCLSSNENLGCFDELRYEVFHKKQLQFNIETFPPTSNSIKMHIKRAFLQCHLWLHAPFVSNITIDPLDFGYTIDEEGRLVPEFLCEAPIPDDFPSPCNCVKCARARVCPCRVKQIACCKFCKCKNEEQCNNPNKTL